MQPLQLDSTLFLLENRRMRSAISLQLCQYLLYALSLIILQYSVNYGTLPVYSNISTSSAPSHYPLSQFFCPEKNRCSSVICKGQKVDILPIFKHQVHCNKYTATTQDRESDPFPCSDQPGKEEFYTVCSNNESDKIGNRHHEEVEDSTKGTDVSVPSEFTILPVSVMRKVCRHLMVL